MSSIDERATIYIAFGANQGDRQANLARALELLREQVAIESISSLYETEPAYMLDQPRFLNGALRGRTSLEPLPLLQELKTIEATLGRKLGQRYGPRPVDLDILLYDNLQLETEQLTIPHPRMFERAFVLIPLAEIAADLISPGQSQTVAALAQVAGQGPVVGRMGW